MGHIVNRDFLLAELCAPATEFLFEVRSQGYKQLFPTLTSKLQEYQIGLCKQPLPSLTSLEKCTYQSIIMYLYYKIMVSVSLVGFPGFYLNGVLNKSFQTDYHTRLRKAWRILFWYCLMSKPGVYSSEIVAPIVQRQKDKKEHTQVHWFCICKHTSHCMWAIVGLAAWINVVFRVYQDLDQYKVHKQFPCPICVILCHSRAHKGEDNSIS